MTASRRQPSGVSTPRRGRAAAVWLSACALLLAALLPLLSHLALGGQDAGWTLVCGATGAKLVRSEAADPAGPQTPAPVECPYCALHLGAPDMPPPAPAWQLPRGLRFAKPECPRCAARARLAWAPGLARGPPATA